MTESGKSDSHTILILHNKG